MAKRTVVVGTGFLGAAVVQLLRKAGMQPIHTYRKQRTFSDSIQFDLFRQRLSEVVSISEVGTVVFTARMEDACDREDLQTSVKVLFREACNMRIVYLSSDAVFDGRRGMYVESDAPNPLTPYGRNKATCEDFLKELAPNHCIIRPSYIFGFSRGVLDPRLTQALAKLRDGVPFHRFIDMYKSPIEVNRLAGIVVQAVRSSFRGILHAGSERVSVYDFYRKSLMAMGVDTRLLIPERLPVCRPADFLVDTSLDSRLLAKTFGETPLLAEGFSGSTGSKWHVQGPRHE